MPRARNDFTSVTADADSVLFSILANDRGKSNRITQLGDDRSADTEGGFYATGDNGGTFWVAPDGSAYFYPGDEFLYLTPGQTTTTSITYEVTDIRGRTDTATIFITVSGPEAPPTITAVDDVFAIQQSDVVSAQVSLFDNDIGSGLTVVQVGDQTSVGGDGGYWAAGSNGGHFWVDPQGQAWFSDEGAFDSLAAGETATSTVTYVVTDDQGEQATATLTATITGENDAPVATNVSASLLEDMAAIIAAAFFDIDASDSHNVSLDTTGTQGIVTNNGDGTFSYDPNGTFNSLEDGQTATDSFVFIVDDGNGGVSTATATVTINGVSDLLPPPPSSIAATDDTTRMSITSDVSPEVRLLDNDLGSGLSVIRVGNQTSTTGDGGYWAAGSNGGHFWVNPQGQAWFFDEGAFDSLAAGSTATSSVDYVITNDQGETATATLTATLTNGSTTGPDNPYRVGDWNIIENIDKIGLGIHEVDPVGFSDAMDYYNSLNAGWYYNWWTTEEPGSTAMDFVPMIWGGDTSNQRLNEATSNNTTGDLLGFNEPDITAQSNMTVSEAVSLWSDLESTGLRLGSPATSECVLDPNGWFAQFMAEAETQNLQIDFIALHAYTTDPDVAALESYLVEVYETYQLPIWVTELALVDWTNQDQFLYEDNAQFLTDAFRMLDDLPFVERYAWFSPVYGGDGWDIQTSFLDENGNQTAVGQAYEELFV